MEPIPGRRGRWSEHAFLAALAAGPSFALLALLADLVGARVLTVATFQALAATAVAASLAVGFEIDAVQPGKWREPPRTRFAEFRQWARLKTTTLVLLLLLIVSGAAIVYGLFRRLGDVGASVPSSFAFAAASLLIVALGGSVGLTQLQAVTMRHERDRSDTARVAVYGAGVMAIVFAALGWLTASRSGLGPLHGDDAAYVVLAGMVAGAIGAVYARNLPTPYAIYDPRAVKAYGPRQFTYTRSFVIPTLVAFSALSILLLLLLAYGIGTADLVQRAFESVLALAVIGFLVLVVILSLAASFILGRRDRRLALYHKAEVRQTQKEAIFLGTTLSGGLLFMGLSYFVAQGNVSWLAPTHWLHLFAFGWIVAIGPYGWYKAKESRRTRMIEDRFPDFLRDIASSHRGGMTLAQAIRVSARSDYGELTGEVQKMADQLSWNVPLEEALARFAERVRTPLVRRTVSLILEAGHSGGNTVDVLLAASRDARAIKALENQRRMSMALYAAVIYVTFFVFLGVTAVLYARFIPEIADAGARAASQGATGVSGLSIQPISTDRFRTFFFIAAVAQGLGNGIIAGVMGTGRWELGLRHAAAMVLVAWFTFAVLV